MKRPLTVGILMLYVVFMGLVTIFAAAKDSNSTTEPVVEQELKIQQQEQTPEVKKGVNSTTDANAMVDPNAKKTGLEAYEGLNEEFKTVTKQDRKEIHEWVLVKTNNRIDAVKAAHEQVIAELNFLRKIADEEKAAKTVAVIDALLVDRQKRFDEIAAKVKEEKLKIRREHRAPGDMSMRSSSGGSFGPKRMETPAVKKPRIDKTETTE
jgi:hypothetical protein